MELRDYLRILRAHWVGAAAVVLVTLLVAAVYTFAQPKIYAADANGFVSLGTNDNPALNQVNDEFAKSRATSYVEIARSRETAEEVKRDLKLDDDASSLVDQISVEQPVDTVLLQITARDDTARGAQRLANSWVAALAKQVGEIEDPSGAERAGTPRVVALESAVLPKSPASPNPTRNLGIALILGLLLALGYALVRNTLDRRIRTPQAVEQKFETPVVGVVPLASVLGHEPGEPAKFAVKSHGDGEREVGASEAFRKLRTNLMFMDVDNPPKVIVVTSPRPGDGKSTVAANLAVAVAESGQDVTLVDADLRRPSVAKSMGLVEGVGLTDVLIGRVEAAEALQVSGLNPRLSVMAAGRIPPNPSELLGSKAMRSLVSDLSASALVILDAPPLLPVTDAAVLTANADGALLVITTGKTLDHELQTSISQIEAVKGRALGVIMNRAPRRGDGSYYGGYYYTAEPVKKEGFRRAKGKRQKGQPFDADEARRRREASAAPRL